MERLAEEEVHRLIQRYREGDRDAERLLVDQFYPLVKSVARGFRRSPEEAEDLEQVGYLGFTKALQKYDHSKGAKFSTFAVIWVKGEILTYLRQGQSSLKVGTLRRNYRSSTGISDEEKAISTEGLGVLLTGEAMEETPSDENLAEEAIQKIWLKEALKNLAPLERKVVFFRFFKEKTQEEAGKIIGISQRQVSRMEQKVLSRIKKELHF